MNAPADRCGLHRDVGLDLDALVVAGAGPHGALALGGAQPREALTLRPDDSISR
ncbi:hypothetical protein [Sorangium sp. So ce1153]|uniref:hypothetical protein n=1 Tax=Sorangium sp. So ce1153 TaxID=3133333 RepID=UPI003F605375